MKSNKAFILLGVLFAVLLLVSSVVAAETPQNEAKVDEAKEIDEWAGNEDIKAAVANLCEKPSQTWSGKCGNTQNCDKQCISWEGAKHGACHKRGNWKCFCYFNC